MTGISPGNPFAAKDPGRVRLAYSRGAGVAVLVDDGVSGTRIALRTVPVSSPSLQGSMLENTTVVQEFVFHATNAVGSTVVVAAAVAVHSAVVVVVANVVAAASRLNVVDGVLSPC